MHKVAFALDQGQGLLFALLWTPLPPQRRNLFCGIATMFSCTRRARARLWSKPSIWSGDNGVTKHLAHPLAAEVGSGTTVVSSWWGKYGVLGLCGKALFTWVGRSRGTNSQILHKGSLP